MAKHVQRARLAQRRKHPGPLGGAASTISVLSPERQSSRGPPQPTARRESSPDSSIAVNRSVNDALVKMLIQRIDDAVQRGKVRVPLILDQGDFCNVDLTPEAVERVGVKPTSSCARGGIATSPRQKGPTSVRDEWSMIDVAAEMNSPREKSPREIPSPSGPAKVNSARSFAKRSSDANPPLLKPAGRRGPDVPQDGKASAEGPSMQRKPPLSPGSSTRRPASPVAGVVPITSVLEGTILYRPMPKSTTNANSGHRRHAESGAVAPPTTNVHADVSALHGRDDDDDADELLQAAIARRRAAGLRR